MNYQNVRSAHKIGHLPKGRDDISPAFVTIVQTEGPVKTLAMSSERITTNHSVVYCFLGTLEGMFTSGDRSNFGGSSCACKILTISLMPPEILLSLWADKASSPETIMP